MEGLVVFTRYPEAARTKTRLIPLLGAEGAADLHRRMAEHTLARLRQLRKTRPLFVQVRYEGGDEQGIREWLGFDLSYRHQGGGDLGQRMARAFQETLRLGIKRVVLVGTDCPGITSSLVEEAFDALREADVVLGPARDGGYYLIGLREFVPRLFAGVPWGTETVLAGTRDIATRLGLSVRLLPALDDVDRPEDLPVWEAASGNDAPLLSSPRLSIVIPTFNEGAHISETLESLREASDVEIIVVDGGSTDETMAIVRSYGVRLLSTARSRAGQMNAGSALADGEALLFLHGDTRLPKGFDRYVHGTLNAPGTVAGAFELHIDGNLPGLRLLERAANWRSRWFGLPYGDQAIFLGTGLFRTIGGFREMPIMEDFELMRRLRRCGRIGIVSVPVVTSARRWERIGVWQATLINYVIPVAYYMGVSPSHLARWYRYKEKAS